MSIWLPKTINFLIQDDKDKKRPGSRGSAKSKSSQEKAAEPEPVQVSTPVPDEFWPVSIVLCLGIFISLGFNFFI